MAKRKPKSTARSVGKSKKKAELNFQYESRPTKSDLFKKAPKFNRYSTHKRRAVWFQSRESWPYRDAPIARIVQERARVQSQLPPLAAAQNWQLAGPSNIGGRMTSIVSHPTNANKIWAGAAGGGVWRSDDGGLTWESLWHSQPTLNVGSLAIDTKLPTTIYAGTGEANLSADSHPGVGLYRSLDEGTTWQLLASTDSTGIPRRIGALMVDPFDSNHILLGGVRHISTESAGLYRSTDGGQSWAPVNLANNQMYNCHCVEFHPTTPGTVMVTIDAQGSKNGFWRSKDFGVTWTQLTTGLPSSSTMRRAAVAYAPSNPKIVVAIVCDSSDKVLGVYQSSNGGDSWASIGGSHFNSERQMFYNCTIAVHPTDPKTILCGGVDLHKTTNGGNTWKRVTRWDADRGTSNYAHADHHALLMPASQPGLIYDMNDGGMDVSLNSGTTWQNRSNGLATNMFYDLEVSQSDGKFYGGGAQDNGTITTLNGQPNTFQELTGGDGGWIVIDPTDSQHLFSSAQGMLIFRFRPSTGWVEVSPPENSFAMWMVFIAMDHSNPKRLFTASRRVWRTLDDGNTWKAVSDVLDGSDITAIEIARNNPQKIYVATENGGFFRSLNGGDTWSGNLASTLLPGRTITRIESKPDDANTVYISVAGFGSSHVFRSTDQGDNWADIDRGDLPDVPHHSLCIPVQFPDRIYVANDIGVFVSTDDGASWQSLTGNLPNVMVVDVVYHETDKTLFAATYGRSIWKLSQP